MEHSVTGIREKYGDYFLKTSSYLTPCYDTVSPIPYHEMYLQQMRVMSTKFCKVTSAYIEMCKMFEIKL